nr:hypothetical protein [Microbispora sp. H11081]
MISLISYYADLAIGLVLAFLLLSLLVSGINEGIVRLLGIRSKFLWAYLRDTLDGAETADGTTKVDRALDALQRVGREPTREGPLEEGRSRLPAGLMGVFARLPFGRDPRPAFSRQPPPVESPPLAAAADSVAAERMTADSTANPSSSPVDPAHGAEQADPGEAVVLTSDTSAVLPPDQGKSMAELLHERLQEIDHAKRGRTSIADIPPARFAVAVLEIATQHGGVERLMRDLDALKSPFYRPLQAVWDRASHDLEAFRRGVEDWFDGEMERLSLLYRRYVRWVLVALGLVVTMVFSMDSLEYGKSLLRDNAYRSAVTAFGQSGPQALEPLREQCEPGQDPYACVTDVLSTPAFVKIFSHAPVNVTMDASGGPDWAWRGGDWWERLISPGHWPGYLVTVLALLFGAPFWWDILRRVSGLRTRTFGSTPS